MDSSSDEKKLFKKMFLNQKKEIMADTKKIKSKLKELKGLNLPEIKRLFELELIQNKSKLIMINDMINMCV